jgi:hypothetical protein
MHQYAQGIIGDTAAFYPLINTAEEVTGNYDDVELINAPFAGDSGVYSNGIYVWNGTNPPDGSLIRTGHIAHLYDSTFAVQVEFMVDSISSMLPVIVLGDSWRYLGLAYMADGGIRTIFNGGWHTIDGVMITTGTWYVLTIRYTLADTTAEFWLDGQLVDTRTMTLDRSENDGGISNSHFGAGLAFRGFMRNLLVMSDMSLISALDDPLPAPDINLFPNPATDRLLPIPPAPVAHWVIYGQDGKICMSGGDVGHEGIDISGLSGGIYFMAVRDAEGHSAVLKWVKVH